jgi:hypothetical protein
MARDRPYDDGASDAPLERRVHRHGTDAGSAATTVEPRSRLEYYEVIHAADSERRTARSGWDAVAPEDRPQLDAVRVTPERTAHILDGDGKGGGGHRHGTGQRGKTEFPKSWSDERVIAAVVDVARKPDKAPVHQDWNDSWLCGGTRDSVEVSAVVLRSGEVLTGWPEEGGPGVVRNPRKGKS